MVYLLDADVFIRAKNLHDGLAFCPAFWDWLVEHNASGTVFSVEMVVREVALCRQSHHPQGRGHRTLPRR